MSSAPCIVLDNGAGRLKYGLAGEESPAGSVQNCTATINKQMHKLIGSDVDQFPNGSLLNYTRPFDRGHLVNWGAEIDIWKHVFGKDHMNTDVRGRSLVVTEAPFTPEPLRDDMDEVVFEEFQFGQYFRRPASWFAAYEFRSNPPPDAEFPECCLMVDSGFSFSHLTPFVDGRALPNACRRVNVGGKLLTNYLKEITSFRQWNMMDEFKLIDQVKEELCYVSMQFEADMKHITHCNNTVTLGGPGPIKEQSTIRKFFVMPDFQAITRGYVKPDGEGMKQGEQLLMMESERFAVPEVLFHPSDIGMDQAGIAEAASQSLSALSEAEAALAIKNVVLTGGNTLFPNFRERYICELRPLVPEDYAMNVYQVDDPINYAWRGASHFARDSARNSNGGLRNISVTREEYLEHGSNICRSKFSETF